MARIDAHQHFWCYQPVRDRWITDEMAALRRDFLPADLSPLLQAQDVAGCVAVQASQSEAETDFLLSQAQQHDFIRGVVGWVDLQAADAAERVAHYARFPKLKGFRHVLQSEADRALMLQPQFGAGLAALAPWGLTYDLLILPDQLRHATALAAAFPDQAFVVDHLAKPAIRQGERAAWERDLRKLAAHPNVHCKASGLVTEADWTAWQPADFRPYLDAAFAAFGSERLMFGSDWPVCLLAGRYDQVVGLLADYLAGFSVAERAAVWGDNAARFYHLS